MRLKLVLVILLLITTTTLHAQFTDDLGQIPTPENIFITDITVVERLPALVVTGERALSYYDPVPDEWHDVDVPSEIEAVAYVRPYDDTQYYIAESWGRNESANEWIFDPATDTFLNPMTTCGTTFTSAKAYTTWRIVGNGLFNLELCMPLLDTRLPLPSEYKQEIWEGENLATMSCLVSSESRFSPERDYFIFGTCLSQNRNNVGVVLYIYNVVEEKITDRIELIGAERATFYWVDNEQILIVTNDNIHNNYSVFLYNRQNSELTTLFQNVKSLIISPNVITSRFIDVRFPGLTEDSFNPPEWIISMNSSTTMEFVVIRNFAEPEPQIVTTTIPCGSFLLGCDYWRAIANASPSAEYVTLTNGNSDRFYTTIRLSDGEIVTEPSYEGDRYNHQWLGDSYFYWNKPSFESPIGMASLMTFYPNQDAEISEIPTVIATFLDRYLVTIKPDGQSLNLGIWDVVLEHLYPIGTIPEGYRLLILPHEGNILHVSVINIPEVSYETQTLAAWLIEFNEFDEPLP